ncbi:MAG: hypothetical protein LBP99_08445 [Azoarcus sp.]|jgi:hypothetical protein|nr:hypothetical protein [Azoarcus sp.]
MATDNMVHDPLEFVRNMWGRMGFTLPGMVTPTLDVGELEKRIGDMRAVEGWLKMNLSMLQMAIQGLDMQRAAIAAVHAMSQPMQLSQPAQCGGQTAGGKCEEAAPAGNNPFLWPWTIMNSAAEAEKKKAPAASAPVAASDAKTHAKRKVANSDK